jgi:primosomal protein N' (replication factor Y) (superfamily II helicase)
VPTAVQVLFPLPLPAFSYVVPFDVAVPIVGCRVAVPWQHGLRIGIVIAIEEVKAAKVLELKELVAALDDKPFLLESRIKLLQRLATHTCSPLGQVLASLLPSGLNEDIKHEVRAVAGADVDLSPDHWTDAATLKAAHLDFYRRQGLIREQVSFIQLRVRILKPARGLDEALKKKSQANQKRALEWLLEIEHIESGAELARQADVPESAVRALIKKGYIVYEEIIAPPPALPTYDRQGDKETRRRGDKAGTKSVEDTRRQGERVQSLPKTQEDGSPSALFSNFPVSLAAISGGTRHSRLEALLPRLQAELKANRSVLVLVPEQAYLVETASYLQSVIPVQTLSGELSHVQRQRLWQEVQVQPLVLIGTYLALLAPLENLGCVVVLEEGNSSYKLQAGPRLVISLSAQMLAEEIQVPYLVTESLPTVETLQRVSAKDHVQLLQPEQRWHVADLAAGNSYPLSNDLIRVLKQVEERKRQAILLAPRRGFSAAFGCSTCHWLAMCPNCDLPLRYHKQEVALRCHQCGFRDTPPNFCPKCAATTLGATRGAGTQWIVTEIKKHIGLPLYRFDADQRDNLLPLQEGEAGVVVGTTALLRQPPLPNVSLVVMTLLDTLLTFSDFRAEEEAMRLLLQLAELTHSRRPLVLLQTFQTEHPMLTALTTGELAGFLARMLERRKRFNYPPFSSMAKIQVSAKNESIASEEASAIGKLLERQQVDVLGPSPAPVTRLKGLYNYQLFVRAKAGESFQTLLRPALEYQGRARVRVDIDPKDIGAFLE